MTSCNLWIDLHYFPSLHVFQEILHADVVTFDMFVAYGRKSYQNRCYIATSQGLQRLVVPVQRRSSHGCYKDVCVDYTFPWQRQHIQAMRTAYGKTPFYCFLEDLIAPILHSKPIFLHVLSQRILDALLQMLQVEKNFFIRFRPLVLQGKKQWIYVLFFILKNL